MSSVASQVFISHSSRNRAEIDALRAALEGSGVDSLFLSFDPIAGIPPGRDWERELYLALRRCDAVIGLDSTEWRESPWCFAEVAIARSLGKTVILLQVGDNGPTESGLGVAKLAADSQSLRLADFERASIEPLLHELNVLGVQGLRSIRWNPARTPYPGLVPLQEEDAGVFFGRRAETLAAIDLIEKVAKYGEKQLVLLIGPSGSGKSSLLRAGILPQLRLRSNWRILGPFRADPGAHIDAAAAIEKGARQVREGERALVALDQLDEALGPDAAGSALFDRLAASLEDDGRVLFLGTLRADALGAFDGRMGDLSARVERFVVGPLNRADYREIIVRPAEAAGVSVEETLVDELLADVASSGERGFDGESQHLTAHADVVSSDALPLLAVTLKQLWEERDRTAGLTLAGYARVGGLSGAVARTAEEVVSASALDETDFASLREAFVEMVRIDRTGRLSRQPLALARVRGQGRVEELLGRFVDAGLLVTGATGDTIELAHEALIRTWARLAKWVEDAAEDLFRLERFELALARWRNNPEAILEGLDLVEAEELAQRGHGALQRDESAQLLEQSVRARDDALAREAERQQAVRVSESLRLASEARDAAETEPETALLVACEALLWDRNELSEGVFRETIAGMPAPVKILRQPRTDIVIGWISVGFAADGDAIFAVPARGNDLEVWSAEGAALGSVALPGSGPIAAGSSPGLQGVITYRDDAIRLHDLSGEVVAEAYVEGAFEAARENDPVLDVSSGGVCLLRCGGKGWLLDVNVERPSVTLVRSLTFQSESDWEGPLHGRQGTVLGSTMDRSGQRLLTWARDDTIRVWSVEGSVEAILEDPEGRGLAQGAFLADGRIVTGTLSGAGHLWSSDGSAPLEFTPVVDGGWNLFIPAVDVDGEHFATSPNQSGVLSIWDSSGTQLAELRVSNTHVRSAAFSPDGRYLATGSDDRTVRVWDRREHVKLAELHGHAGAVDHVVFHPRDSSILVSCCMAGSLRRWTLDAPPLPAFRGHQKRVDLLVRTPGGVLTSVSGEPTRVWDSSGSPMTLSGHTIPTEQTDSWTRHSVLTADAGGTPRLWSLPEHPGSTPPAQVEFPSPDSSQGPIQAAISQDESRVLIVYPGSTELWSAQGQFLARLIGVNDLGVERQDVRIVAAAFRPGGHESLTAAENGMVWLWSADGLATGSILADHASPDRIFDVAVDPLGEYIAVGVRSRVGIWTWEGQEAGDLQPDGYKVRCVEFAPNGTHLVTIADNPDRRPSYIANLWERSGRRVAVLHAPDLQSVRPVLFGEAGTFVCLEGDSAVRVFDLDGRQIGVLGGPRGTGPESVAVSPNGRDVAACFSDGVVRIWNFDERRRTMTFDIGKSGAILFNPDGRRLLHASPVGRIEQHALDVADLFASAAARAGRGFTEDELARFGIKQPVRLDIESFR